MASPLVANVSHPTYPVSGPSKIPIPIAKLCHKSTQTLQEERSQLEQVSYIHPRTVLCEFMYQLCPNAERPRSHNLDVNAKDPSTALQENADLNVTPENLNEFAENAAFMRSNLPVPTPLPFRVCTSHPHLASSSMDNA